MWEAVVRGRNGRDWVRSGTGICAMGLAWYRGTRFLRDPYLTRVAAARHGRSVPPRADHGQ